MKYFLLGFSFLLISTPSLFSKEKKIGYDVVYTNYQQWNEEHDYSGMSSLTDTLVFSLEGKQIEYKELDHHLYSVNSTYPYGSLREEKIENELRFFFHKNGLLYLGATDSYRLAKKHNKTEDKIFYALRNLFQFSKNYFAEGQEKPTKLKILDVIKINNFEEKLEYEVWLKRKEKKENYGKEYLIFNYSEKSGLLLNGMTKEIKGTIYLDTSTKEILYHEQTSEVKVVSEIMFNKKINLNDIFIFTEKTKIKIQSKNFSKLNLIKTTTKEIKNFQDFQKRILNQIDLIIPLEYQEITPVVSGEKVVFVAKKNNKYGLIGASGEQILPFDFDAIANMNEGRIWVSKGDQSEVRDQTGKILLSGKNKFFVKFENNQAIITDNKKTSIVIDRSGKKLFDLSRNARRYSSFYGDYYLEIADNKVGLIDFSGKEILAPEYDFLTEDYLSKYLKAKKDSQYILLDKNAKVLWESPKNVDIKEIQGDHLILGNKLGKIEDAEFADWKLINFSTNEVILKGCRYNMSILSDSCFACRNKLREKTFIFNLTGDTLGSYDIATRLYSINKEQIPYFLVKNNYLTKNPKVGLVAANGKEIWPTQFGNIISVNATLFIVSKYEKGKSFWEPGPTQNVIVNIQGEELFHAGYASIRAVSENIFQIQSKEINQLLFLQEKKLIDIPPDIDVNKTFHYGNSDQFVFKVSSGKNYGLMNSEGKLLVPVTFKSINIAKDYYIFELNHFFGFGKIKY